MADTSIVSLPQNNCFRWYIQSIIFQNGRVQSFVILKKYSYHYILPSEQFITTITVY